MQTAYNYQTSGIWSTPPVYQFAAYEMDSAVEVGTTEHLLMWMTANYVSGWAIARPPISASWRCTPTASACGELRVRVRALRSDDTATNYDVAMSSINTHDADTRATAPTSARRHAAGGAVLRHRRRRGRTNINRLIQPINGGSRPTTARRSRIAASRSPSSTPNICRCRPTRSTSTMSRRSKPTSALPCRPAPRPACTTTRRSATISARRCRTLFKLVVQSAALSN